VKPLSLNGDFEIVMHVLRRTLGATLFVFPCCLLLTGCGSGSTGPTVGKLAPVVGKVTFQGAPLVKGALMFNPMTGTPGSGAFGTTDEKGEFKLIHRNKKEGIEPGTYRVVITRMAMKDGSPVPEGKSAADVEAVQIIPPPFSDPNSDAIGTSVTVPAEGKSFNFDI
jgi:hypothetical protein